MCKTPVIFDGTWQHNPLTKGVIFGARFDAGLAKKVQPYGSQK
jgi:uncharacterized protein (DUF2062 family)